MPVILIGTVLTVRDRESQKYPYLLEVDCGYDTKKVIVRTKTEDCARGKLVNLNTTPYIPQVQGKPGTEIWYCEDEREYR